MHIVLVLLNGLQFEYIEIVKQSQNSNKKIFYWCSSQLTRLYPLEVEITFLNWAAAWQNKQNNLCAQRRLISLTRVLAMRCKDSQGPSASYADSEDSDQTGRMPSLILVFAGRSGHFVGFVMRQLISYLIILSNISPWQFSGKLPQWSY